MFTLADIAGALLAVLLYVPVLLLPGLLIRQVARFGGADRVLQEDRLALALLAAYAVVPIASVTIARFVSLHAALLVMLVLAAGGLAVTRRELWSPPSRALVGAAAAWAAIVILSWIDIEWRDNLYLSLITVDMLKHAATTRALVETGSAPLADPFFLRDGAASFYYFYFVPAALVETLGFGLIDSRMAVCGQIVWTGAAILGLAHLLYKRSALHARAAPPVVVLGLLMCAAGVQMILVLARWITDDVLQAQSNWVSEMVVAWPISLVWVPHHVSALLAGWAALLALIEADQRSTDRRAVAGLLGLAAAALASAFGLSAWVTFGVVGTVAIWTAILLVERRYHLVACILTAGIASLVLAAPHIYDALVGRPADAATAVVFSIRWFSAAETLVKTLAGHGIDAPWIEPALRLLLLPVNYLLEFGVFALGVVVFWMRTPRVAAHATETGRLVTISAVAGLLIGSFLKSNIGHNDLGWRVVLWTQMAALLWTAHVVMPLFERVRTDASALLQLRFLPRPLPLFFAIGCVGVAYDLTMIRVHAPLGLALPNHDTRYPTLEREMRHAFEWLNTNLDRRRLVLQHNPDAYRAYSYALYGRYRVAVADVHQPILLGAPRTDVHRRLADLIPVFRDPLAGEAVRAAARRNKVDLLFVTSADPIWSKAPRWLIDSPAVFTSAQVRVIRTDDIVR